MEELKMFEPHLRLRPPRGEKCTWIEQFKVLGWYKHYVLLMYVVIW